MVIYKMPKLTTFSSSLKKTKIPNRTKYHEKRKCRKTSIQYGIISFYTKYISTFQGLKIIYAALYFEFFFFLCEGLICIIVKCYYGKKNFYSKVSSRPFSNNKLFFLIKFNFVALTLERTYGESKLRKRFS